MQESDGRAGSQGLLDARLPDRLVHLVGQRDHDQVGCVACLVKLEHVDSVGDRHRPRVAVGAASGDHPHATVSQIQGLGAPLISVAENRNRLSGKGFRVSTRLLRQVDRLAFGWRRGAQAGRSIAISCLSTGNSALLVGIGVV